MRAARAGDDQAFESLYRRYQRRIAAYVNGMVHDYARAEDITQDVFISALRRMRQTDTPIAFKPWIYEIAKNACIDAFRRSKRAEEISYDADDTLGDHDGRLMHRGPAPEVAVDQKMSLEHLRGAFGGLSDAHHQILVMRELEGLSYRQIGEKLGMSRPSVESTLFRARRRLAEEYEELVSGERCRKVAAILAASVPGELGARDERRVARHISWCQPCRRHAGMAGFDVAALSRKPLRTKVAAWLPLPAFLRRRWLGGGTDGGASAAAGHGGTFAQLSNAAAMYGDAASAGWSKAAAVAVTMAIAGLGAGVASQGGKLVGGGRAADRAVPAAAASAHRAAAHPSAVVSSRRIAARATGTRPASRPAAASHTGSSAGGGRAGGSAGAGGGSTGAGSGAATSPSPTGSGALAPVTKTTSGPAKTVTGTAGSALKPVTDTVGHVLNPSGSSGSSSTGSQPAPTLSGTVGQVTQTVTQPVDQAVQSLPVVGSSSTPAPPPPSSGGSGPVSGTLGAVKDTPGKLLGG